jgi:hypothetical protein
MAGTFMLYARGGRTASVNTVSHTSAPGAQKHLSEASERVPTALMINVSPSAVD